MIANVDAIAPGTGLSQAVILQNGEPLLVRMARPRRQGGLCRAARDGLLTQAVLESSVHQGPNDKPPGRARHAAGLWRGRRDLADRGVQENQVSVARISGQGPVEIPAQTLPTTALWLLAQGRNARERMKAAGLRDERRELRTAQPGDRGAADGGDVRDSRDLGGVVDSKNLGRSTMICTTAIPAGPGLLAKGFDDLAQVLHWPRDGPRMRVRRAAAQAASGCRTCGRRFTAIPTFARLPDAEQGSDVTTNRTAARIASQFAAGSLGHVGIGDVVNVFAIVANALQKLLPILGELLFADAVNLQQLLSRTGGRRRARPAAWRR